MKEFYVTIRNKVGLHARPVTLLVKTAQDFKSKILVCKDGQIADAKSILNVLALGAVKGTSINLCADGEDETEAIAALKALFESNFNESE